MMKTNFMMLRELIKEKNFSPKRRGVVFDEEIKMIEDTLCLEEMDILALRNLRDFTVMYFTKNEIDDEKINIKTHDIMSGITAVIDQKIFNLGGEV